jgi:hypothetical protein
MISSTDTMKRKGKAPGSASRIGPSQLLDSSNNLGKLRVKSLQAVEKGSECFENLSMNGKSSMISKPLRSSGARRRTPREFFNSLFTIDIRSTPVDHEHRVAH